MIYLIRARINQGYQSIPDVTKVALPAPFRGLPEIMDIPCSDGCSACLKICPTAAINLKPFSIDLKRCILCPDCEIICPVNKIKFTQDINLSSTDERLMLISSSTKTPIIIPDKKITSIFKRSLKLRSISAAGCNACELELNACSNVNFDMGRFGIEFVASPRHADGVVITGPISANMAYAAMETIKATPDPKIIILSGTCAMSGGPFYQSKALSRDFLKSLKIDLYIGGCPPHPLTFINALLKYLERS
ncbi:MAG: NADH:ubiquinone oxidoreductase [Nitrospirae bacterium]|nr:NADH:ubiquinone oxidoreductase [Nitrospirota bacterium]MBF0540793.1 NADH:ubiquinone oxidoreductase [Nitrospirota bacterium]